MVFLAASGDHEFLLSHKGNASNILNKSFKPTKSYFVENSFNPIQITSPIPNALWHPIYNAWNGDAQAEYLAIVKIVLRKCIKDINFADPVQRKEYTETSWTR